MDTNHRNLYFASWLRVFAMLLILACHFSQMSSNSYLVMSSQFFDIANYVFFNISGFLFGEKGRFLQKYSAMVQKTFYSDFYSL